MAKVAFILIAFNSDYVLEPCLRSVLPFGKVYAAEGPVKFWQERNYSRSTDRTIEILDRYGIPTIHGQWNEKTDEANAALSLVPDDTEFIFCLDADEIWKAEALRGIFEMLDSGRVDSMSFKAVSFFGGFDRYMTGFEENFEVHRVQRFYPGARFSTHRPPTILARDGVPMRDKRHINHEFTAAHDWRFYHYSYVFPSQMYDKARYYEAMGGTIRYYFSRVYLRWVMGDEHDRATVEDEFDGVHNWLPQRRGPCRTAPFTGTHPAEIERVLPALRERIKAELAESTTNEC